MAERPPTNRTDRDRTTSGPPSLLADLRVPDENHRVPATAPDEALLRDDLVTDRALTENDPDRLNHAPIAARVLDLVTVSDPPVNVALFGAWGSGKSSFSALLDREIKDRGFDIRIVNYNAWTFTGESLQRNFISHAAAALGVDPDSKKGRRYHRGLYQSLRSSSLELSKVDWLSLLALTLVVLASIVGVVSLIVFIAATVSKQDPVKALQDTIPSILASSAVTALLVAGVKQILDGARLDTDQSAPTQEQLHETFLELMDDQTKPLVLASTRRRVLFFIDELDRCPKSQVVETLAAIRNYFEAPGCMFVVAADRQVLERAFDSLPYGNPGDAQNPYYGSASEFFDKIFQYQIPLPPLRGATLLRLAHDLVSEKATGVWADLRKSDDGLLLDLVLYALIPSNVRSPRRVKVLVNAFATHARIANARGLPWLPRAREIAKLTALQVEFPLFANDLLIDPHLPSYLLDLIPTPSARLDLVAKHRLEPVETTALPESALAGPSVTAATSAPVAPVQQIVTKVMATDPTPRATPSQANEIRVAQRRLLHQYLVRVADVPDVGRDLLYLSSAGQAVDLGDPALATLIEEQAVDDPNEVIAAAAERTEAIRQRAVRLLAGQILQGFGVERTNLVSAMLGIAKGIGYRLGPAADEATNALATVEIQGELGEIQLVDSVGVALGASPASGEPFIARLFADARLLAGSRRLAAIASFADRLGQPRRANLWSRIGATLPTDRNLLTAPLSSLPLDIAKEMVGALGDAIRLEAGASATVPAEAPAFAESLFIAANSRRDGQELAADILEELVSVSIIPIYAVVRKLAPSIVAAMRPPRGEEVCMAILIDAPPEDWGLWTSLLPVVDQAAPGPTFGVAALASLFSRTDGVASVVLVAVVTPMIPALKRVDETVLWTKLEPALSAALAARPWATSPQAIQIKIYTAALALVPLGEPISSGVEILVAANIVLGLQAPTTPQALAGLVAVAATLPAGVINVVAPALVSVAVPAVNEPWRVRSQIGFASAMGKKGPTDEATNLLPSREAVLAGTTDSRTLPAWLGVQPPADDVRWMATQLVEAALPSAIPKATIEFFSEWAAAATVEDRTGLLTDVLSKTDDAGAWIEAIAPLGVDEALIVVALSESIRAEPKAPRRADLSRNLISLRPNAPKAQALVAELMLWLLERRAQADFDTATRLVRAVGTKHKMGMRLSEAFQAGVERGHNLPPGRARELRDSGILTKRKLSWLDKLLGK